MPQGNVIHLGTSSSKCFDQMGARGKNISLQFPGTQPGINTDLFIRKQWSKVPNPGLREREVPRLIYGLNPKAMMRKLAQGNQRDPLTHLKLVKDQSKLVNFLGSWRLYSRA